MRQYLVKDYVEDREVLVRDYREDLSVSDSVQDCVNKKIHILAHEHPDWTHEHVVGASYGICRKAQDFFKMLAEDYINTKERLKGSYQCEYCGWKGPMKEISRADWHHKVTYCPKCDKNTNFVKSDFVGDAMAGLPVPNAPGAIGGPEVKPMRTLAEAVRVAGTPAGAAKHSSNVQKVGYYNSMLEVEFHGGRRYVYFVGPQFYDEFVKAKSKGKWLWENLRGKRPGLVFDNPNKVTPGGVPYSGGEGSLVPYSKGSAGTPDESLKPQEPQLPDERERELLHKELEIAFRSKGLRYPKVPQPKSDFTMSGFITRSGEFDYGAHGVKKKDWGNLRKAFQKQEHFPAFGKRSYGAHKEAYDTLVGYAHGWEFFEPGVIDKDGHIYAKIELFDNIWNLSDLKDPSDLPVSIGFIDVGEGDIQNITHLRHLAISLNKLEGDRCSTMGGLGCNISTKNKSSLGNEQDTIKNYNMEKKKMGLEEEVDDFEEQDVYEDGAGNAKWTPEQEFKKNCAETGHSPDACNKAYDAIKKGGAEGVKSGTQNPSTNNWKQGKDMIEITPEEYADLLATARVWKENKDFIENLQKADKARKEKEAIEVKDFLLNHVEEDFVKQYGKSLCDLKLMQGVVNHLIQKEVKEDDFEVQKINNAKLMEKLGNAIDDFEKLEKEYKEEAYARFFPK